MNLTAIQRAVYLLIHTHGIGTVKARRVLDGISAPSRLADAKEDARALLCRFLAEKEIADFIALREKTDFDRIERELEQNQTQILTVCDANYPSALRNYEDMPLLLYARGDIALLGFPAFAIVGTRYPTRYGVRATEEFAAHLSERFVIVSGLARGVDGIAHKAALDAGGKTIAVLGCGVDIVYPHENRILYEEIAKRGLLISEYGLGVAATAHNFPARNRIISGLSRGVLVTEAGEKSGTMLTARNADEQGKPVYAVPGSIYSSHSTGCNKRIKEQKSLAVVSVNDIYEDIGMGKADLSKPSAIQLDINEECVISSLTDQGEMHFEEILEKVDLTVPQLSALLIKMEALGLIMRMKNNYWSV